MGDVELWACAIVGASDCWPKASALGGRPAKVAIKFFPVCQNTLEMLRAAGVAQDQVGDDGEQARRFLANTAQGRMRAALTQMFAEKAQMVAQSDSSKKK